MKCSMISMKIFCLKEVKRILKEMILNQTQPEDPLFLSMFLLKRIFNPRKKKIT